MRTLGTRRAALVAGVATVAAVALAACSAGQVAETALKNPSTDGVNTQNADASVLIRGLAVTYPGTEGYEAGGNAPLEVNLYNETTQEITVLVSSQPLTAGGEGRGVVSARAVGLVGGSPTTPSSALPEPSGSRPVATPDSDAGPSGSVEQPSASGDPSVDPSETADPAPSTEPAPVDARPARIAIGPLSFVSFQPGNAETLQAIGLSDRLAPGNSVNLVFEFSNGTQPLVVQAPVAVATSPASRAPGGEAEEHEG
ncbi:hypothetical protein [Jidongwangia harbinensis]|uniref:hypothetical protein n=1 Tax=Jidongwangia harbinensis TaxID=2878561 RepID=UPI001CD97592|nr:hypothetical protein [Jidongwangia harbinensis]MCA2213580.1 hypothetical protein [Jidongwangia harbinensis]